MDYVRNLNSVDDLEEVAYQVFGSHTDERCEKFKQAVLYYCRGNRNAGTHLSNATGRLFYMYIYIFRTFIMKVLQLKTYSSGN